MTHYIISFNQQWVGNPSEAQLRERGLLASAVVAEMKDAGVYIFAGGLDNISTAISVDATSGGLEVTNGPFAPSEQHLGGLTIVDVADDEAATMWAGKLAVACGWPQEVRRAF